MLTEAKEGLEEAQTDGFSAGRTETEDMLGRVRGRRLSSW